MVDERRKDNVRRGAFTVLPQPPGSIIRFISQGSPWQVHVRTERETTLSELRGAPGFVLRAVCPSALTAALGGRE